MEHLSSLELSQVLAFIKKIAPSRPVAETILDSTFRNGSIYLIGSSAENVPFDIDSIKISRTDEIFQEIREGIQILHDNQIFESGSHLSQDFGNLCNAELNILLNFIEYFSVLDGPGRRELPLLSEEDFSFKILIICKFRYFNIAKKKKLGCTSR